MSTEILVPNHVGIILDGNRRWAKARGLPTLEGHRQGAERFREISIKAFERGVKYLSAYIFSTENWKRSEEEVGYLMALVVKATEKYLDDFHKAGIKIVHMGTRTGLSTSVLKSIDKTVTKTRANTKGTLALCFNYGGHSEVVDAANAALADGHTSITKELISEYVYAPEVPPIDFMIRTSGERRSSGFMLWRSDYAEMYFTDYMWPDFDETALDVALADYSSRQRRFGK